MKRSKLFVFMLVMMLCISVIASFVACETAEPTFGSWELVKAPTATETGEVQRTMTTGDKEEVLRYTLPKLDDVSYTKEVVTAATCGKDGETRYNITIAEPHYDFDGAFSFTIVEKATGAHTWTDWQVDPDDNTKEYRVCSVCAKRETRDRGHVHAFGDWAVTTAPTADAEGVITRTCTGCEEVETANIPKLNKTDYAYSETAATCETAGEGKYSIVKDGVTLVITITIPATGHAYGDVVYTWSDDGKTCTAKSVCANDASHVREEDATITSAVALEPTCTTKGKTIYTATFASDWAKSEKDITKTVEDIAAIGHAYGEPSIVFSADKTKCTSTRICANDKTHVITSTVDVTTVKTLPTCETDGSLVYTAAFDELFGGVKTETVVLPAIGHAYGEVVYDWSPDFSECTATRTCTNDASHKIVAKSTGVRIENVAATCGNKGSTTYIASFDADWIEVARHVEYTDALPHNFGEAMYIWSDDCTNCTARRVCQNDANHIEEATATITSNVDKLPTCEETGKITYTATFSESWATTVTQPRVIAATGHRYETYRFDDIKPPTDTEAGDLIAVCSVCGKETKIVGAAPAINSGEYKIELIKNPTCLEKGTCRYTLMYEGEDIVIYKDIPVEEHDFMSVVVTTAPTELSDGEGVRVCIECNTKETIVIPKLDKNDTVNYTYEELQRATCEYEGTARYRHKLYTELTFEVTLPMKPHVMSEWMVDVNKIPTFTNKGIATRSCECGYKENRVLPALNDTDYVKEVKTSATCSVDGLETYSIVIDGETLTIDVNIPMTPHTMTPWTVTLAPTTTTKGSISRDCSNCDRMHEERDISAISVANGYVESNRVEPTSCTEAGHADYTIELYGQQFVFNNVEIPAPGHVDGDWTIKSEATCSAKAVRELRCARCGEVIATESFGELKPHTYGDWNISKIPTADAAGTADITCAVCSTTKHVDLPALDNINYEYKVVEPASEGVAGIAQYIYPHEIKDIVIEVEVPALAPGHTCTTYKWIKKVDPTEQSVGSVAKVCAECGKETGETFEMPIISVDNGYKVTSTIEANCVEGGRKVMQYTLADGTVMTYVITSKPLGHTVQEYHYYMSSDQTKAFREGVCAICGTTVVEEAVSVMQVSENAPTCTVNGEILFYATFAGEADEKVVTVELPATGHTFGEWIITREPTLHSQGNAEMQCSNCNETKQLILPAISVDNGYTRKEVKAPTCNATGLDTYSITREGKVMSFDVEVPYLPHNYGAWQVVKLPSADDVGLAKRTCPDCNAFEEYELPIIYSYQYTVLSQRNATCKEVGEKELSIDVNGEMLIFKVELPKIEHREEDIYWKVITEPTETTKGEIVSLCRECGTELDRVPLPVLNPNDLSFYSVITLSYGDCNVPTVYQFTAVQKHGIDGNDITFKLSKLGKHSYHYSSLNTVVTNDGQDAIEIKVCDRCDKMNIILNKADTMNRAEEMPLIKGEPSIDEYYNVINMLGDRPIHMSVNRAGVVKEYDMLNNVTIIGEGKLTTYVSSTLLTISNEGYRTKKYADSACNLIINYIRENINDNYVQHIGGELFEVYDYNDELIATMNLNAHSLTINVIEDDTTLVFSGCNRYIDIQMENNLMLDKLPNMYNIDIQFIEDGNRIKTSTISYVDGETAEDLRLRMPSEMDGKPVTYYENREMTKKFNIDEYLRGPSDIIGNGLFALVGNKVTTVHVLNTMTWDKSVIKLTRDNISWTLPHEEVEGCDFVGWRMQDTREFVDVDKLMMDINANNAPSEMFVDAIYMPKTYEITRVFEDRTDVYEFVYGDEFDMTLPPKEGNKELVGVFLDADHTIPFDEQYFSEHPQDLTIYVHYIDFSTHTHKLERRYFDATYEKNAREADFCKECQREFNVKEYPGTMLDLKYYLDKNASLFKNYDYQYLAGADAIEYLVSMQGPSVGEQLAGCKIEMVIINDKMAICAGDETAMNFLMRQIRYAPYVDTNFVIAGGDFLIDAIKLIEATIVENGITYDKHKEVIIDVADEVTTLNIEASVMAVNPSVMEEHDFTSITVDADNTMFKIEGSTLTDEMCVIFAWGNGETQYDEIYYVSSAVEWLIVPSNATVVDRNGAKILTFVGPDDIISDIDPTFYIYSEEDPNTFEYFDGRYYYWHMAEDGVTPVIWELTGLTFGDPIVLEDDVNLDNVTMSTTADKSVAKIEVTNPTEKKPHFVLYDEKKDIHSLQVFKRAVDAVNNSARMSVTVTSYGHRTDLMLFTNGYISKSDYGIDFTFVKDGMHYIYSDGVMSYGEAEEYEKDIKNSTIVEGMPEIILLSHLDWQVGENGTYVATIPVELFNLIASGRPIPQDFVPTKPDQIMTFILTISEDGVYTILHKEAGNIPRFKYVIEENAIRLSNENQTIVVHDIDGYQDISFISGLYDFVREPFTIELVNASNNENINTVHYDMNVNTKEDLMKKLTSPDPKIEFLGLYDDSAMTTPFDIDAYIAAPCNRIIYVDTKSLVFTEGAFKGMADSNLEMFAKEWNNALSQHSFEVTKNGKLVGYGADRKTYNVEKNIYNEMIDYNTFKAYEFIDGQWLFRMHHDDILYDPMQLSELLWQVDSSGYKVVERGVFETTGDKFPTPVRITIVSTTKESKVTVTSGKNTMIYTFGVDRVVTLPEGAIENPDGGMVGPPPPPGPGPGPGPKPVPGPGPIPVPVDNELIA